MWIFGYGSLMWDGWEQQFDGKKVERAVLEGYRRAFNKKSVTNWGTEENPCPTLGLERDQEATCTGVAFKFPEALAEEVSAYLRDREGPSFDFVEVEIILPDSREVQARVAVNDPAAESYIGDRDTEAVASMISETEGDSGTCIDYLTSTRSKLRALSIEDEAVETLWKTVQQEA